MKKLCKVGLMLTGVLLPVAAMAVTNSLDDFVAGVTAEVSTIGGYIITVMIACIVIVGLFLGAQLVIRAVRRVAAGR